MTKEITTIGQRICKCRKCGKILSELRFNSGNCICGNPISNATEIIHFTKSREFLKSTKIKFKPYERFKVIFQKIYNKRSSFIIKEDGTISRGQNGYWWGVIIEYALSGHEKSTGTTFGIDFMNKVTGEVFHHPVSHNEAKMIMHEFLLDMFNKNEDGTTRRSHENTKEEQEQLHEQARNYIRAAYDIKVPMPGEGKY